MSYDVEWRHVQPGSTVRIRSGLWWVSARTADTVTLTDAQPPHRVTTGSPPPSRLVTVLEESDPVYIAAPDVAAAQAAIAHLSPGAASALATALVQVRLGAHVLAIGDACPVFSDGPQSVAAAHLWVFHDLTGGDIADLTAPPPMAVLTELHQTRSPSSPHVHTQLA